MTIVNKLAKDLQPGDKIMRTYVNLLPSSRLLEIVRTEPAPDFGHVVLHFKIVGDTSGETRTAWEIADAWTAVFQDKT